VRHHRLGQYGVTLASALITVPAVLVLMPLWGLPGVGIALVGGQSIVAAVVLLRRFARRRPPRPA
jgi:O-antigen/teichoic acid export membrane protein